MWRNALALAVCTLALVMSLDLQHAAAAEERSGLPAACDEVGVHVDRLLRTLLGRKPEPAALAYWASDRPMCATVRQFGLIEVSPGLAVGREGDTVTVVGDRRAVTLGAEVGELRRVEEIAGDVVVNANWYTSAGPSGPVVANGRLDGTPDTIERGQLLARRPSCRADGPPTELEHLWTGELYHHDPCVVTAISGISIVHKGVRADRYPGYDLTTGYTNTARAHSFVGFNDTEIVIVATREMTASELADYAISLGVTEGIMLDGGGSTQIATPTASLRSSRAVPAFAVLHVTGNGPLSESN